MEQILAAAGVLPPADQEDIPLSHLENTAMDASITDQSIARLAYALWQFRGCPMGSPEVDWTEAEQQLRRTALLRTGAGR